MIPSFHYYNPVRIEFGEGSIQNLSHYLQGRKALLITSKGFTARGTVQNLLEKHSEIVRVYDQVNPNPTLQQVEDFFELVSMKDFEVIIALGGGSVIDFAKAISFSKDGQYSFDIFYKTLLNGEIDRLKYIPIIGIPTTAGTSSELTPWGTIWDDVNKVKHSIHTDSLWCETAIYDPELTYSLPKDLTIQTGLDALSHSLESIWNCNRNPISEKHAIEAIQSIVHTLPLLAKDLSNKKLRRDMMYASMKSGLAFSNTQTAIAHAMSYYLTLHHNIPHGIAASITLPTILKVALDLEDVSNLLIEALGDKPIEKLLRLFTQLNVSYQLNEYGLDYKAIELLEQSLQTTSRLENSLVNIDLIIPNLI